MFVFEFEHGELGSLNFDVVLGELVLVLPFRVSLLQQLLLLLVLGVSSGARLDQVLAGDRFEVARIRKTHY
jgi:hypothetical protein